MPLPLPIHPLDNLAHLFYLDSMKLIPWHDIVAGVVAVGLLVLIGILAVLQRPIPEIISLPFASVVSWALRGGVQAGNELRHRKKVANEP